MLGCYVYKVKVLTPISKGCSEHRARATDPRHRNAPNGLLRSIRDAKKNCTSQRLLLEFKTSHWLSVKGVTVQRRGWEGKVCKSQELLGPGCKDNNRWPASSLRG